MRVKLSEKYQNERQQICDRIIEILELDEFNSFLLSELDANETKKTKIMELRDEIPKYFAVSSLSVFAPTKKDNVKRDYLVIIKNILKQQGFTIEASEHITKLDEGVFRRTVRYVVQK